MLDILSGDYLYIILEFLEPRDICNLIHVNTEIKIDYVIFKSKVVKKIYELLRQLFGDNEENDYVDFLCNLQKHNVYLSGSTIIQIILGEYYNSDIDFYVPIKHTKFFPNIVPLNLHGNERPMIVMKNPYTISTKTKNSFKINTSYYNARMDFKDYINENFDFDICKNYFSFRSGKLYVLDAPMISRKKLPFELARSKKGIDRSYERYFKYKSRGFRFWNVKNNDELYHILNDNINPVLRFTGLYSKLNGHYNKYTQHIITTTSNTNRINDLLVNKTYFNRDFTHGKYFVYFKINDYNPLIFTISKKMYNSIRESSENDTFFFTF